MDFNNQSYSRGKIRGVRLGLNCNKATTNCIVVSRPGYGYNSVRAGGKLCDARSTLFYGLFLRVRPNYIHSASNDIHTDGPRSTARARG